MTGPVDEPSVEGLKASFLDGTWGGVDEVIATIAERGQASAQEAYDMAQVYAAVFNTDLGRRVLEDLLNRTLRQPAWQSLYRGANGQTVALPLDQVTAMGLQREGQNQIVGLIIAMLAHADQPPPTTAKE